MNVNAHHLKRVELENVHFHTWCKKSCSHTLLIFVSMWTDCVIFPFWFYCFISIFITCHMSHPVNEVRSLQQICEPARTYIQRFFLEGNPPKISCEFIAISQFYYRFFSFHSHITTWSFINIRTSSLFLLYFIGILCSTDIALAMYLLCQCLVYLPDLLVFSYKSVQKTNRILQLVSTFNLDIQYICSEYLFIFFNRKEHKMH